MNSREQCEQACRDLNILIYQVERENGFFLEKLLEAAKDFHNKVTAALSDPNLSEADLALLTKAVKNAHSIVEGPKTCNLLLMKSLLHYPDEDNPISQMLRNSFFPHNSDEKNLRLYVSENALYYRIKGQDYFITEKDLPIHFATLYKLFNDPTDYYLNSGLDSRKFIPQEEQADIAQAMEALFELTNQREHTNTPKNNNDNYKLEIQGLGQIAEQLNTKSTLKQVGAALMILGGHALKAVGLIVTIPSRSASLLAALLGAPSLAAGADAITSLANRTTEVGSHIVRAGQGLFKENTREGLETKKDLLESVNKLHQEGDKKPWRPS